MNKEIWKEIPETNGQYSVSNLGRVKSNYIMVRTQGKLVKCEREKILAQNKNGYPGCAVGAIHRIVAQLFIPNPYNYDHVHHKDGNKHNNCVDNLEWVDGKEHVSLHKKGVPFTEEHKQHLSGPNPSKGHSGSLNTHAKKCMCVETGKVYSCVKEAAEEMGVTPQCIANVCKGYWKKSCGYT